MNKAGDRIDDLQEQLKKSEVENLGLKDTLQRTKTALQDREDEVASLKEQLWSSEQNVMTLKKKLGLRIDSENQIR